MYLTGPEYTLTLSCCHCMSFGGSLNKYPGLDSVSHCDRRALILRKLPTLQCVYQKLKHTANLNEEIYIGFDTYITWPIYTDVLVTVIRPRYCCGSPIVVHTHMLSISILSIEIKVLILFFIDLEQFPMSATKMHTFLFVPQSIGFMVERGGQHNSTVEHRYHSFSQSKHIC